MGVEYSYYDEKTHSYFEMGKWYGWDQKNAADMTPVKKLFLPQDKLRKLLFAYVEDFAFNADERREYAEWLASRLAEFAKTTSREYVRWVNDSDDSDRVISTCRRCKKAYLCEGDSCDCAPRPPDTAKCFGTRYNEEDEESAQNS